MVRNLTNLRFTDDTVLVAKNFNELVTMGGNLKYHNEKFRITMNMEKTKFMSNREGINGSKLSRVGEYRYLGQISKFHDNMGGTIRERILNTWKAFWINKIFMRSKMKTKVKIKILDSCVKLVLTYGAQT